MDLWVLPVAPSTTDTNFLFGAVNEGRLDVAWSTFRFQVKQRLLFFRSNVFGFL